MAGFMSRLKSWITNEPESPPSPRSSPAPAPSASSGGSLRTPSADFYRQQASVKPTPPPPPPRPLQRFNTPTPAPAPVARPVPLQVWGGGGNVTAPVSRPAPVQVWGGSNVAASAPVPRSSTLVAFPPPAPAPVMGYNATQPAPAGPLGVVGLTGGVPQGSQAATQPAPTGPLGVIGLTGDVPQGSQAAVINANVEPGKEAGGNVIQTPSQMFQFEDNQRDLASYTYELSPEEARLLGLIKAGGTPAPLVSSGGSSSYLYVPPPSMTPSVVDTPSVTKDSFVAAPLTQEAYDALSSDQKAAVDFNTLLVDAREKDLSKEWELSRDERKEYDKKVNSMFGASGGSQTVAPNTVNLLSSIDFKAVGQDLDEYLSLERSVTAEKLKDFKLEDSEIKMLGGENDYAAVRTPENVRATESAAIAQSRDFISKAMQDAKNAVWDFEKATGQALGQEVDTTDVPLGYGTPEIRGMDENSALMDTWLQGAYDYLQKNPEANMQELATSMANNGFTDSEKQYFLKYVDDRTKRELQYGTPEQEGQLRGVADIRKLVGLE